MTEQSIVDPYRQHRWLIKEMGGFGGEEYGVALLFAKRVSLPKLEKQETKFGTRSKWGRCELEFYCVPSSVKLLHEFIDEHWNGIPSIRIDLTSSAHHHETVGTWRLDACGVKHFEFADLDYSSSELLTAKLIVQPKNVRFELPELQAELPEEPQEEPEEHQEEVQDETLA